MLRMPLLACAVALVFSAGCTSTPADPEPNGGAGESGTGGSATTGGKGGSASVERCPTGTNPRSEPKPIELGTISGQLVDEQGDPTSAGLVQVCGKDICINARVGSNGKLAEVVDDTRGHHRLRSRAVPWRPERTANGQDGDPRLEHD